MTSHRASDMTPAMASDMVSHMNDLFQEYIHLADAVQTHTREIMGALSDGKVPDQDSAENFDKAMTALNDQYNAIYAGAKENLSAAEMPRAGSMAEDYVIAIRNSKPVLIEKRRQIAKILLNRFIRIRSSVQGYTKALSPYQQEASEAMASIDSLNELLDIEKLTTAPRFFFEALGREDIESYEYSKLLKVLGEYYSERVLLGITGKKYFDPADEHNDLKKELAELGYDPSFMIKDDILMKYDDSDQRALVVIPPWIREIASYAFSDCKQINRIFIPNSVQEIQYDAFYNSGINSIVIPDSVTELGRKAFECCSYLKSAVIGNGVTCIQKYSFLSCQELEHLELPSRLNRVGHNAFERCYSLKSVWVDGREYSLRDSEAPGPVKLVYDNLEYIRDRIRSDYENGLMDEFEYVDYNIAGDGYSY